MQTIQNQFLVLENWPAGAASSTAISVIFLMIFVILRIFNKGSKREITEVVLKTLIFNAYIKKYICMTR